MREACSPDALLAGMCARRRSYFLLSRQKKVTKEKATLLAASRSVAAGNLRCSRAGCAAELTTRLRRCVQTAAASQSTKRVHVSLHPLTPPAALLGASRRGEHPKRAIAALGLDTLPLWGRVGWGQPTAVSAQEQVPTPTLPQSGRESDEAERSDGLSGFLSPLAVPRSAGRGAGAAAQHAALRALTRCGCLSGAAQPRSEFRSAAPGPSIAGCPVAKRRGHGQWGRLFFAYFLLAEQKKVGRPPGRNPGQRRIQGPSPSPQPSPQRGEGVTP